MTTKHPFETDHLSKGDTVPASVIEEAFHVTRGTEAYQLAWLRAKTFVVKAFEDRGEVVSVVHRKYDLVILTDTEQVDYNADAFRAGIRAAVRAHKRALGADRAQIDEARLADHDRAVLNQGRILSAVTRERRAIAAPAPRERLTPPRKYDEE